MTLLRCDSASRFLDRRSRSNDGFYAGATEAGDPDEVAADIGVLIEIDCSIGSLRWPSSCKLQDTAR